MITFSVFLNYKSFQGYKKANIDNYGEQNMRK